MKSVCLASLFFLVGMFAAAAPSSPLDAVVLQQKLRALAEGSPSDRALAIGALAALGATGAEKQIVHNVLKAYSDGTLYFWNAEAVFSKAITQDENYVKSIHPVDVVTGQDKVPATTKVKLKDVTVLAADRNDRDLVSDALLFVDLGLDSRDLVLNAIQRISAIDRAPEALPELQKLSQEARDPGIAFSADEALAMIGLRVAADSDAKITLVDRLGRLPSLRALPLLEDRVKTETDPEVVRALNRSLAKIRDYEGWVNVFDILKSSLSSGSILILMAMGLAITFGMMGVINMAHGEMMMIGAYTTYVVQIAFGHSAEHPAPEFFLFALPLSFLVAALVGGVIEWAVVRHLYKKPIESLLATYGVSLILTQVIRLTFGDNRATNTPDWLQGAVEVAQGMEIPVNRFFILLVAVFSVLLVLFIFRYTKVGLNMKATMQNRDMAAAMGIHTRGIDSFTFMLGSGIAGIAGYALTTVGGITPDMGKNYIVDSFLIVVTGGTGSIAGVVVSGAGIGFLNKFLEGTFFGTVWAKIVVLALVMTFIQFRPSGIFAPKGRLADE
jgi:urea transport system permease protein